MSFIFEITSREETREVFPFGKPKLSWKEVDLDFCFDYEMELKSPLQFIGGDYQFFYNIEMSENPCENLILKIYQICGGIKKERFEGYFTTADGKWNIDKCTVEFDISAKDKYSCIREFKDEDYNLFEVIERHTAISQVIFGYEDIECQEDPDGGGTNMEPCSNFDIEAGQWQVFWKLETNFYGNVLISYKYRRAYALTPININMGSPWVYIETINNQKKYVRRLEVISQTTTPQQQNDSGSYIETNYTLNWSTENNNVSEFDNGLKLQDCISLILQKMCPNLSIQSNFFQWNPVNATSINYVTQEMSRVMNLILYQKSDVKRPLVSGNATGNAEISFNNLINDICIIFNLGYKIESNVFILEHISYFEQNEGIDLTVLPKMEVPLTGTKIYSYDKSKMYKYEKFKFTEAEGLDFIGKDIWYNNYCVDPKLSNRLEVSNITTDLSFCLANSDSSGGKVSDNGFGLIACDSNYQIINLPGIFDTLTLNNSLSWSYLHDSYYRYGRVMKFGFLNEVFTEFETTVPNKKQDKVTIPFCCDLFDQFDPLDTIKGNLGWGKIINPEFDMYTNTLSFEIEL